MRGTELLAALNECIDTLEGEGFSTKRPCLMVTGRWYEDFPFRPKIVAPLPEGRGIFILTLGEGIDLRDRLADPDHELKGIELDVSTKSSPAAVRERGLVWEKATVRRLVAGQPSGRRIIFGDRRRGQGPEL